MLTTVIFFKLLNKDIFKIFFFLIFKPDGEKKRWNWRIWTKSKEYQLVLKNQSVYSWKFWDSVMWSRIKIFGFCVMTILYLRFQCFKSELNNCNGAYWQRPSQSTWQLELPLSELPLPLTLMCHKIIFYVVCTKWEHLWDS